MGKKYIDGEATDKGRKETIRVESLNLISFEKNEFSTTCPDFEVVV